MSIDLANFSAISEQLDVLHDCPFDLDQAQLDPDAQAWVGRFLRPLWDGPQAEHRQRAVVIWESRLPVVEGKLHLRAVTEVRIVDDQGIRMYSFDRVERTRGGLQLVFNERLRIELAIDGEPVATYEEAPMADICAVYRQVLLVQTGPNLLFSPGSSSRWAV